MKAILLSLILALGLCSSVDAQQIIAPRVQPQIRIQARPFIPYRSYYRSYTPRYRYHWEYRVNPVNPRMYEYRYWYDYRYPYYRQPQRTGIFFQFRF